MTDVESVLAAAKKKYDLTVGPLSEVAEPVQAVSTGNLAIDSIIGVGGFPLGRSIELYGLPSCGKTTLSLQAAATLQKLIKNGGNDDSSVGPLVKPTDRIVYFDYEQALDRTYAEALGLDMEHSSFLFAQPDNFEDGANLARALVETGEVRLLIWDSVAAMTPKTVLEKDTGEATVAVRARLLSSFMQTLTPLLKENHCISIFLNHEMEVFGGATRPGAPVRKTTPGGRALKYHASLRIEFTAIKQLKRSVRDPLTNSEVDQIAGSNVLVKVVKNKVSSPFKEALVRVRFGQGFDNFFSALQVLIGHKQITLATGGRYYFDRVPGLAHEDMSIVKDRPCIHGEDAVFEFADSHPEWREAMIEAATAALKPS